MTGLGSVTAQSMLGATKAYALKGVLDGIEARDGCADIDVIWGAYLM